MNRGFLVACLPVLVMAAGCAEGASPPAGDGSQESAQTARVGPVASDQAGPMGPDGDPVEVHVPEEAPPLTEEELLKALVDARGARSGFYEGIEARVLLAIVDRGGEAWEKALQHEVDLAQWEGEGEEGRLPELNLLAALRRVQGRPDPLEVAVEGLDGIECTWPALPNCSVTLRNVDAQGVAFRFTAGGDYRTGRYGRFRFDVRDDRGGHVPVLKRWGVMGGMFTRGPMKPGEIWEASLRMADYITLPKPGKYTVRVQYHNHYEIANGVDDGKDLVFSSREFQLTSQPRELEVTGVEWSAIRAQVDALDAEMDLVIVQPGSDGSGVFTSDSPPFRILADEWKAVPVLIESLTAPDVSPRKRAWIFSLLFSLTGLHNPVDEFGAVDEFSFKRGGVSSRRDGELEGGMGPVSSWRERGTKIEPQAQADLVEKWRNFLKNIDVRRLD